MAVHTLVTDEVTAHTFFSPELEPTITIEPGDTLRISTLDAGGGREQRKLDGSPRHKLKPTRSGPGGHMLVGPIAVRGALPGMTLEVQIDRLSPGPWGWSSAGGWSSRINDLLGVSAGAEQILDWSLDRATMIGTDQLGNRVRLRPFLGIIGMPPPEPGQHTTVTPRPWGGNMDCRELVAGSTLYLPVPVAGALLSVGDGHAAQGDGEVAGPAIECPMEAELTIHLRDDLPLRFPQAQTPAGFITLGFHDDLHEAALIALSAMVEHLVASHTLERKIALALASIVVSLRVTQLVNGIVGVHALLPESALLPQAAR